MSNAQRIVVGPSAATELMPGNQTRHLPDATADELWWLGYEAAFPATWMSPGSAPDDALAGA